MGTMQKLTFALAALLVLLGLGWMGTRAFAAGFDDAMPSVGQMAPNFTLLSQTGKPLSLDNFRGKWVVLYFYPKDMSSGCTIEAHNFQQDAAKYHALHAVILGVSVDNVKSHQEFCAKDGLGFHLLADTDHKVSEMYGSLGNYGVFKLSQRHTFLIDPEGKIVKVWPKVDVTVHSAEVLDTLRADEHKG
jgi:peroxiredoxin Q/BCP